ncbi:hypothetical protein J4Q44_G00344800 [Coregonus suidteri]|uniref:Uncharacterized protein n=1 Tax=Coregonus suidteri TaxID=861788 RepID=A0AAN8KIA2_9TELE
MPPHTMTDPPPNRSCWRMLQAAERSPWRLQTLSRLSHVLSVNLLSSVKSTGRQWRICQSWCSLANAKRPVRCWAVSTTPTCGRWALMESVSDRLSRHAHLWPAGGHFAGLWQCSSLHKGGGSGPAAGLLPSYGLLHVS